MREIILDTLKTTIGAHPQIVPLLDGWARLAAKVYAYKTGEAPDDDQRRKDERRLKKMLLSFFEKQEKRILKELRGEFSKSVFQMSFWDLENSEFWNESSDVVISIILHGMDGALALLPEFGGDLIDLDKLQLSIIREASKYRDQWINSINNTTMERVWAEVRAWQETGDPLDTLIKIFMEKEEFLFGKTRAERIAVTETTRLNSIGNELTWQEAGYIKEFNWMTAEDELVCPICRAGRDSSPHPLEQMKDLIPAHVNCRCWGQPIVDLDMLDRMNERILGGINFD